MFLPKTIERVETEREHVLHFSSQTWICVTLPSGIGKTAKTVDQDWWNILQHEIWKFLKSKTWICVSLPSGIGKITAKTEDQDWCRFYSAATWNLKISTIRIWNPRHAPALLCHQGLEIPQECSESFVSPSFLAKICKMYTTDIDLC